MTTGLKNATNTQLKTRGLKWFLYFFFSEVKRCKLLFASLFLIFCIAGKAQNSEIVTVQPEIFEYALNNPLKGFRPGISTARSGKHPYSKVVRVYLKWNELERNEDDSIERIIQVCNQKWGGVEDINVKVIPRVYLDWDSNIGNEYWPSDMTTGDYSSYEFEQRVTRLVKRLAKVWDEDPRIAWIQMGIIGYWGEHHHPSPSLRQQEILGDLFTEAFKNKKVLVRQPFEEFMDYPFGWYWDSFAHWDQIGSQGVPMLNNCPDRWKVAPIEGETAYNWGNYQIQPGDNPNVTLKDPAHREFLINWIRTLHCTALGWVASFDYFNTDVLAGAEEVQRAFGYRYILKEVSYPAEINPEEPFSVSFKVENTGSAPFYYDWPVELRLLDPETHITKWKQVFNDVDIRNWMPGENWHNGLKEYQIKPEIVINTDTFRIEGSLEKGKYILALTLLDPAGMMPAVKFATRQYFNGGLHPIGYVGLDSLINDTRLEGISFDDPAKDNSLHYSEERGEIIDDVPSEILVKPVRKPLQNNHWKFPGDTLQAWQFDYFDDGTGHNNFTLDSATTFGIYGCYDTSGINVRSYSDTLQHKDAAQFNWNIDTQTFQKNGQWLEYSVMFDLEVPYQLIVRAENNVNARFKLSILSTGRDTIFYKDLSLKEDFENLGGGNEQTDWFIYNGLFENLWGAYTIRFDWYDNIGEPGIFGSFSFPGLAMDLTAPGWYYVSIGNIPLGTDLIAITNEDATLYLVPAGTAPDTLSIKESAYAVVDVAAYVQAKFSTIGLNAGEYIFYALDNAGNISEASRMIKLEGTLNVTSLPDEFKITIAYNSVLKTCTIKSDIELRQINVYNILGARIKSIKCDNQKYIFSTQELNTGIYIVHVYDKHGDIQVNKISIN